MSEQKQFGQLIGMMIQNMPPMTVSQMQRLIGKPKRLQEILAPMAKERWAVKDGVIYFTLVSNGFTGEQWITHLNGKNLPVGLYAQSVLRHKDFQPTMAGTPHHIAVLPGSLYSDNDRITKVIRADVKKRKMTTPHTEVACLIRDEFSDDEIKEMGLDWIITLHEPIPDFVGGLLVLGANRYDVYRLYACHGRPGFRWDRGGGFAVAVAQDPQA